MGKIVPVSIALLSIRAPDTMDNRTTTRTRPLAIHLVDENDIDISTHTKKVSTTKELQECKVKAVYDNIALNISAVHTMSRFHRCTNFNVSLFLEEAWENSLQNFLMNRIWWCSSTMSGFILFNTFTLLVSTTPVHPEKYAA